MRVHTKHNLQTSQELSSGWGRGGRSWLIVNCHTVWLVVWLVGRLAGYKVMFLVQYVPGAVCPWCSMSLVQYVPGAVSQR